jgi:hypothetical protein
MKYCFVLSARRILLREGQTDQITRKLFPYSNFARNSLPSYWVCAVVLCSHIPVDALFNLQFPLSNMEAKVDWKLFSFPNLLPFATNSSSQLTSLGVKHWHSSCTFPLSILITLSFPSQSLPKIYNKTQAPSIELELAWTSICLLSNVRKILFQHMPALTASLPTLQTGPPMGPHWLWGPTHGSPHYLRTRPTLNFGGVGPYLGPRLKKLDPMGPHKDGRPMGRVPRDSRPDPPGRFAV